MRIVALTIFVVSLGAAEPFSVNDLLSVRRVGEPDISPDGQWVAFTIREPSIEQNKTIPHIWIVPADGSAEPRQLTHHDKGESSPKWSPDGKTIAFLSSRGGSQQIWLLPFASGGEARQLTSLSTEADNPLWSPDGQSIAFTSDVWPDLADDAAQKKRADEKESSGVKAQIIDHLLYRHWTEFREGKRIHIFITPAATNAPRDLTPGDFDSPVWSIGGAAGLFDFSPDGKELAFTRGPRREIEAWSTDAALCTVSASGGEVKDLTVDNKGWDGAPKYSPGGKYIAYRSQAREGYEADKMQLVLLDRASGQKRIIAKNFDRSIEEIAWSADEKEIYFTVEDQGSVVLYSVAVQTEAMPKKLSSEAHFSNLVRAGNTIVGTIDSLRRAPEIAAFRDGHWRAITRINEALFNSRAIPATESIRFPGALNTQIQAWLIKPPGFDTAKKYPLLLAIHGGPQSAWNDAWSFRWNLMTYAAHGYVVLAPNPHGSTGFGQGFTEQISGDWGGAVFEDVMKAADWAVAQPYIDADRMAAAGASFGGYMINWIMGHTDRFKTLVCHAGVFNISSKYGATEELWFPEWEFKGPPWKNPELYQKFSPHQFAAHFKTPTLVTHGALDYRVPIDQGLQLFTALKRQDIPSRLLYYPDEGHWILKLKNSRLYYETVMEWLDRYLKP